MVQNEFQLPRELDRLLRRILDLQVPCRCVVIAEAGGLQKVEDGGVGAAPI
jgi:hypothetical protein